MKKKAIKIFKITLFIILLMLILIKGVGMFKKTETKNHENMEINQKIIFIWKHENFAFGYQNYGYFIDNKGNMVNYDLSGREWRSKSGEEEWSFLENMEYKESDIIKTIEMSDLKRCYSYLYKINPNARIREKHISYDAGQTTLYGVVYNDKNKPTFILIRSEGDYRYENTDKYAKKIIGLWETF